MLRVRLIRFGLCQIRYSPPREEGWLRHKEKAGEAHLSAADGVVAHKACFGVSDHPDRFASTPPHEEGITARRFCEKLRQVRRRALFSCRRPTHSAHPAPCSKAAAM